MNLKNGGDLLHCQGSFVANSAHAYHYSAINAPSPPPPPPPRTHTRSQVTQIVEGHWAVAFIEEGSADDAAAAAADDDDDDSPAARAAVDDDKKAKQAKLPFVVDPAVVFGAGSSFQTAQKFEAAARCFEDWRDKRRGGGVWTAPLPLP